MWLLLTGLLATSMSSYIWLTLLAAGLASVAAAVLVRFGDRGVATGVALVTSIDVAAAMIVLGWAWATTGWPLW